MSTALTSPEAGRVYARSLEERLQWLLEVCQSPLKSPDALKVAIYLFACCNSTTGQCNPNRKTIEANTSASHGSRAIAELKRTGLIQVRSCGFKSNQYDLVLRSEDIPVPTAAGADSPREDTTVPACEDGTVLTCEDTGVLQTCCLNRESEQGTSAVGVMPDDWRPSDRDVGFASMSGMDNKEIALQVPLFVEYNQEIRKTARSWSLNWRRWVTAWKRKQIEDAAEPLTGDKITRSLKAALADDRPCWERYGGARTPASDPAGFVRSGCSLFGGCQCSEAERQEHVDRAGGRHVHSTATMLARMAS
ncbi:MAG: hypothetical protein AAGA21_16305 [Pseudomonadota bacterium]